MEIANDISGSKRVLDLLKNDGAVREPLAARGIDGPKIETGLARQADAQSRFTERQTAMGQQEECTQKLNDAVTGARQDYADFRKTVTTVYPSKGPRTALGCTGKVPADFEQFNTVATASYTTATKEPYQTKLAEFGYPAATLGARLEALKHPSHIRGATEMRRFPAGISARPDSRTFFRPSSNGCPRRCSRARPR